MGAERPVVLSQHPRRHSCNERLLTVPSASVGLIQVAQISGAFRLNNLFDEFLSALQTEAFR